jgi:hypothetical protein
MALFSRVPSRVTSILAILGLLFAAVGGVVGGMRLGEAASEPGSQTLTVADPRSATPRDDLLRSPAGFTGFEDGALGGVVTRSGTTTAFEDGRFSVVTGSAVMDVRISATTRLYRLVEAPGPLATGDVVVVSLDATGAPIAVLTVPADLREGDSRGD